MRNDDAKYLVRFSGGKAPQSIIWEAHKPLPLGYPANFVLEKTNKGLRLRTLNGALNASYANSVDDISVADGVWSNVSRNGINFEIRRLNAPRAATLTPELKSRLFVHVDPGQDNFKKIIGYTHLALAVFLLTVILLPSRTLNKVDDAVIPPQFAKILTTPKPKEIVKGPVAAAGGSTGEDATPGSNSAVKITKAADTAVVKAFRAKALQSAVQGLLKGGMTSLLAAQSDLLAGDAKNQSKRIFDRAATEGSVPASPDAGVGNGRGVAVAALGGGGGGGVGGGLGANVGYGAGQKAGIKGQGEAFVSLDLPNSSVEEGLTKDEVGKVIHSHISEIRYCYESSMIRAPDVEGKLVLDFTINGGGNVKTAAVKESSLNDPRLDDCILRRLTKWSFPKPNGGVDVAVSYPFIFKALKR